MALERIPADIRKDGGVARMSDPVMIREIKVREGGREERRDATTVYPTYLFRKEKFSSSLCSSLILHSSKLTILPALRSLHLRPQNAVTIPVMAKARIGHFVEAQILEALEVDYIDESEVLTMADEVNHIDKTKFSVPFVCGCRNLGEALRRIAEGAGMLRTKGEAGTGNVVEAVRHARTVTGAIKALTVMADDELFVAAKNMQAPYDLVKEIARTGKLPVVNFAAGGEAKRGAKDGRSVATTVYCIAL
jgi:pyridoxal biosynthesis lyase PdxS